MNFQISASKTGFWLLAFILVYANFNISRWNDLKVIDWDVIGFYAYLPATFIYHDYKLEFVKKDLRFVEEKKFWPQHGPNDVYVIKPTMGLSMLYAPFFFAAHLHSQAAGIKADGFTKYYHQYIHLSCLFYLLIGLYFLRKLLKRWFDEWPVTLSLISVVLGSNLFYYSTTEASMSHAYTFSVVAVYLYALCKWFDKPSMLYAITAGLTLGLIVLIRPINVVFGLIPVFYALKNVADIRTSFDYFFKNKKTVAIALLLAFAVILPQLLYWKSVTGQFFFYSYLQEKLNFFDPHILSGMFSFRNGWLIYTPVMIFALIGIYRLFKFKHDFRYAVVITLILFLYLVFSWWCWWYVGFGNRAMIDIYALLAIPMAGFFQWVFALRSQIKLGVLVLFVALVGLNCFQILQYKRALIHFDGMNFEAYKASFGRLQYTEEYKNAVKSPDYEKAIKGEE